MRRLRPLVIAYYSVMALTLLSCSGGGAPAPEGSARSDAANASTDDAAEQERKPETVPTDTALPPAKPEVAGEKPAAGGEVTPLAPAVPEAPEPLLPDQPTAPALPEALATPIAPAPLEPQTAPPPPVAPDQDMDGVADASDNCPNDNNIDQADSDKDGIGDACDADLDNDGVAEGQDNCPQVANPDQQNSDGDLLGDACDPETAAPEPAPSSPVPLGLVSSSPAKAAQNVVVDNPIVLTFDAPLKVESVNAQTLQVSTGGAPLAGSWKVSAAIATFSPAQPLAYSTNYAIAISTGVMSEDGRPFYTKVQFGFKTAADPGPLTVVDHSIPQGATDVPVTGTILIKVSKPLIINTLAGGVQVTPCEAGENNSQDTMAVTYNETKPPTIILNINKYTYSCQHTVHLTSAITDLDGNALEAYALTFTTQSSPTPLTITKTFPANQQKVWSGTPMTTPYETINYLTVSLSASVTTPSALQQAMTVTNAAGQVIPGNVIEFVEANPTYSWVPSTGWKPYETYMVTIAAGLADSQGNALAEPYTWSFQTESPPVIQSMVATKMLSDGKVAPDSDFAITFSEPMNASPTAYEFSLAGTIAVSGSVVTLHPTQPLPANSGVTIAIFKALDAEGESPTEAFHHDFEIGMLDQDGDGFMDSQDNCPAQSNPTQQDMDKDGIGDVCDAMTDLDKDQVNDAQDNCPKLANPDQADLDGDNEGDVCDSDDDGDGISDGDDNCQGLNNSDQKNADADTLGDACDDDDDNDTVPDVSDNCPFATNPDQKDTDGDAMGDACDSTPIGNDDDGDGVPNTTDNCRKAVNPDQKDADGDGVGDACDATPTPPPPVEPVADADGDLVKDDKDNCPTVKNADQRDTDGDGKGDACDTDASAPAPSDAGAPAPTPSDTATAEADQAVAEEGAAAAEPTPTKDQDSDEDGVLAEQDNCPNHFNPVQTDSSKPTNNIGDACDPMIPAGLPVTVPTKVTTVAGKAGGAGHASGVGNEARLTGPAKITSDGTYLYFTNGTAESKTQYLYRAKPLSSGALAVEPFGKIAEPIALAAQPKTLFALKYYGGNYGYGVGRYQIDNAGLTEETTPWLSSIGTPLAMTLHDDRLIVLAKQGLQLLIASASDKTARIKKISLGQALQEVHAMAYNAPAKELYIADFKGGAVWKGVLDLKNLDQIPNSLTLQKLPNIGTLSPFSLVVTPGGDALVISSNALNPTYTSPNQLYLYDLKKATGEVLVEHGDTPNDGTWDQARVENPRELWIDANGVFYVVDGVTIRAGAGFGLATVAGATAQPGQGSGMGPEAMFQGATQVAISPNGKTGTVLEGKKDTTASGSTTFSFRIRSLALGTGNEVTVETPQPITTPPAADTTMHDLAISPTTGKRYLLGGIRPPGASQFVHSVFHLNTADAKATPILLADIPCKGKNYLGSSISFDTLGRLYLLIDPATSKQLCGTMFQSSVVVISGLNTIDETRYGTAGWATELAKLTIQQILLPAGLAFKAGAPFALTEASTYKATLLVSGEAGLHSTTLDIKGKLSGPASQLSGITGKLVVDGLGDIYIGKDREIWFIDAMSEKPFHISGNDENGVRDGEGQLGRHNQILDLAYDQDHNRIFLLDTENVLRVVHQ